MSLDNLKKKIYHPDLDQSLSQRLDYQFQAPPKPPTKKGLSSQQKRAIKITLG